MTKTTKLVEIEFRTFSVVPASPEAVWNCTNSSMTRVERIIPPTWEVNNAMLTFC